MFKCNLAMTLAIASFINPVLVLADEATQEKTLATLISNNYLSSMFGEEKPSAANEPQAEALSTWKKLKIQLQFELDAKRRTLTARETQKIAFDLTSPLFKTTVIDDSCIKKLELVAGGENTQQHLLGNIFKDIQTTMGKAYSALALCHPTTDIAVLKNRQQAIALISENTQLIDSATVALKKIAQSESKSLQPWHSTLPVNADLLNRLYIGLGLNTQTLPLELYNKAVSSFMLTWSIVAIPFIKSAVAAMQHGTDLKTGAQIVLFRLISPQIPVGTKLLENFDLPFAGIGIYQSYTSLKTTGEISSHLQDGLIATASHIAELKKLSSLINKNPELLTHLPSLQSLADFNNSAKHSANLNKLIVMLDTNTFKGEASFFSITGRVLAAHELMKQVKDELAPVFAAAGELDMYVALAKLYNEHENKDARYCMVNFIENSSTPVIEAEGFWNPFIDADTVVINNALFDASCPNSILTGPNTGGKSTVIKAIMLDVLMAQTFGIAPAQSLSMTPFTKLNCFMNISDDIATGASLFKSEVMRAKKLLDTVQSLNTDEFSFVIIDEVFTGTSPKEGEAAAMQFTRKLGTYKNNISIIATHYPKMVDLETETKGNYRNHHLEILRNEDGSLNRTFKLKNGPSFMNVAFDILEEEGLFV